MQCHACADAFLAEVTGVKNGSRACPGCLAPATLVGSHTYGWSDLLPFNEIRLQVRSAQLTVTEAQELLQRLAGAKATEAALREALSRTSRRLQCLTLARAASAKASPELQLVVGMLMTVLGAVALACGREG